MPAQHGDATVTGPGAGRLPAVTTTTTPQTATPADPTAEQVAAAIAGRRFTPAFQPVYSLRDGRLLAVEALTRFTDPPGPSPLGWFRAAERAGLGAELEIAAVEVALDAAADLPPDVALSVNVSPATLCDPRLVDLLAARADRPLVVEITEHTQVHDYDRLVEAIETLRGLGVRVAVDDAGTGASTVHHTLLVGPEVIKIDMSLARGVAGGQRDAMIDHLLAAARITGAELVVEGVEDVDDLLAWIDLGADAVQGYLVGRPGTLPAVAVSTLIVSALAGQAAHAAGEVTAAR